MPEAGKIIIEIGQDAGERHLNTSGYFVVISLRRMANKNGSIRHTVKSYLDSAC
jgi:hypothetical protein